MARILEKTAQKPEDRNLEEDRFSYDDPYVFPATKILAERKITSEVEYLVKFRGYSAKYNEWVSDKNVSHSLKQSFLREKKKIELKRLRNEKKKLKRQANRTKHSKVEEKPSATTTSRTANTQSLHETAGQTAFPTRKPELQVSIQKENFSEVSGTSGCVIPTFETIQETMQRSSVQKLKQFVGGPAESQPNNGMVPQEVEVQHLIGFDDSLSPIFE